MRQSGERHAKGMANPRMVFPNDSLDARVSGPLQFEQRSPTVWK